MYTVCVCVYVCVGYWVVYCTRIYYDLVYVCDYWVGSLLYKH